MQRERVVEAFAEIQTELVRHFEEQEHGARFQPRPWQREGLGSGTAMILRGKVFEKSGVNFSNVGGGLYPIAEEGLFGLPYFATGVSTVSHMHSPHVPAAHANIRYLEVGERAWFGGGADLTPCFPEAEDTALFHAALRDACERREPGDYARFKEWCDKYFYIEHRKSPRGVGGIFFDHLPADDKTFHFVLDVAHAFGHAFKQIVARKKNKTWSDEERERLEYFRGRYVEFNLIYDRGTLFGLKSGGDPDLIFMSLPPMVRW